MKGIRVPRIQNVPDELASKSVDELIELKERADQLIREKLQSEKQALLEKLDTIHRYEMTAKTRDARTDSEKKNRQSRVKQNGDKEPKKSRIKAAAKYRDPKTGATWAGRGMQPRWLREAIVAGATEDDFLIRHSEH